jgi:hypothetical protein
MDLIKPTAAPGIRPIPLVVTERYEVQASSVEEAVQLALERERDKRGTLLSMRVSPSIS